VIVIYRPGSDAIDQRFFEEFANLFDSVACFQEPIFVVGDFNVRLEREADADTRQFKELLAIRGLTIRPTSATHRDGGTIDAVIIREDMLNSLPLHTDRRGSLSNLDVSVLNVGLSDHHLLTWSVNSHLSHQQQPLQTVVSRPWRSLDTEQLCSNLMTSPLCQHDAWLSNIDEMAAMYDDVMTLILDRLIPQRTFVRRPRPSDPWFDGDCRNAKRVTRRLECTYAAACRRATSGTGSTAAADAAKVAWYNHRRQYRGLLHDKRSSFWREIIEAERASPRKLWQSVDQLLGRGCLSAC